MNELAFLFGTVRDDRARDVAAFLEQVPHLCQGALAECDLGIRSSGDLCAAVVRIRDDAPEAVNDRLAFWAWKVGGSTAAAVLRCCDVVLPRLAPGQVRSAALSLLARLEGAPGDLGRGHLSLRLPLGTLEAAGVSFERRREALFVPSPHSPPLGDDVRLELRLPDGRELQARGVVTAARAAGEVGPGSPAGFVLGLAALDESLTEALDAHAGPLSSADRRRAPRYTVRARAKVSLRADGATAAAPARIARLTYSSLADFAEDYVENLSQGGAFVRTDDRLPAGTQVQLDLEMPGGEIVTAPAVVVYGNDRGVGVRFELDDAGEAAIADALMHVTARRRRALVVDDDLLGRRMLGDALAERGFEVFAAADATDGLRSLIEQLLGLDLLVTDLRMPGLDGEQLLKVVRGAGGEKDLAVVVVSGDVDAAVEQRLLAAGADAVLAKGRGGAAIADAAEKVVLRRRRPDARPAPGLAGSVPPGAAVAASPSGG